jgi:hypothetical protein
LSNKDETAALPDWPIEDVPDTDVVYRRVHTSRVIDGVARPSAFPLKDGLSTDWQKYSTAEQARKRAPKPSDNGIVSLQIGKVRAVPLEVKHTPIQRSSQQTSRGGVHIEPNQAHVDVIGEDTLEMRIKLSELAKMEILPDSKL